MRNIVLLPPVARSLLCSGSCIGSVSVSSCRCCVVVSFMHHVAVLNAEFCMTLPFVNVDQGCKRRPYGRNILQFRYHDGLVGSPECLLLFTPSCWGECYYCM